jgi:chromosomal replication initiator protein
MIACETRDAWMQFLEYTKGRCSASAFGNWLKPIQVLEAARDSITLEVPNVFVKEYLLTHYKAALCSFLPVDANGEPLITFVISQKKGMTIAPAAPIEPDLERPYANRYRSAQ